MSALKKILPASALALMLASGAANALPHPQFGDTGTSGLQSVVYGLDESNDGAAATNQPKIGVFPGPGM